MRVTSPAFEEGEIIPAHWCAPASDTLPRLEIDDVPPDAVSLVAIPEDPESPLGTVTHWLVWNIPPETRYLDPVDLPDGATAGSARVARANDPDVHRGRAGVAVPVRLRLAGRFRRHRP